MPYKIVFGLKNGKSVQKEFGDEFFSVLKGKRLGDKLKGEDLGLAGYELEITGGSDHAGFPMRKDVDSAGRKRILAIRGVGLKKLGKGIRQRKTVCGNTIHQKIAQINLKVLKEGSTSLIEQPNENAESAQAPAADASTEKPKS